jgi:hypothetical protein
VIHETSGHSRVRYYVVLAPGPPPVDAGTPLAGSLVTGTLPTGALLTAGGELVVGGGAPPVERVMEGGAEAADDGALDGVPGEADGEDGFEGDGGAEDGGDGFEDDGGTTEEGAPVADDAGGGAEDADSDRDDDAGEPVDPLLLPPATRNVTYSPNRNAVPATGSDASTRASSGGGSAPSYATASPASDSRRLASPKDMPVTSGTERRSPVRKTASRAPVVPTGRSTPRPGSATSTRASCFSGRDAGRTAVTSSLS